MSEGQIQDGAGNQGGQDVGQAGSASQAGNLPDWGAFRGTLGDLGKEKSLDSIKDFPGLVKNYVEAQKLLGKPIRLPGKEEKEKRKQAIDNFLNHLRTEGDLEGIPESPDKYQIKVPQEEGFELNAPLLESFLNTAHRFGVTPSQAQGLFDWYLNYQAGTEAQETENFIQAKEALKKEYGGLYTRRMEAGRRAAIRYLGEDGEELINKIPLSITDKNGKPIALRLVKALAEIGDSIVEDAIVSGELSGIETASSLQKKLLDMINDKNHPLNDISSPGHEEAVKEYNRLNAMYVKLKK